MALFITLILTLLQRKLFNSILEELLRLKLALERLKYTYRVEEKYASDTVHYKTITFWETSFMNSNFGSYQK